MTINEESSLLDLEKQFKKKTENKIENNSFFYFFLLFLSLFLLFLFYFISNPFIKQDIINNSSFTSSSSSSSPSSPSLSSSNLTLKWGIVGLGRISNDFAVALNIIGGNLTAVAAGTLPHSKSRAIEFGSKFNIPANKCYGTYEEIAADPDVDIVYIGNTNQLHYKTTLLMIDRGKHVLVEKPTAMTVQQTKHMISAARAKGVFFSTNFWTRYFPAIKFAREQMESGCVGDIVGIRGDFGFQAQPNPNDRYFNHETGGGALFDMGCYLIQFATMAHISIQSYKNYLKEYLSPSNSHIESTSSDKAESRETTYPYEFSSLFPDEIASTALVGGDGVDVETSFILRWKSQSFTRSLQQQENENNNQNENGNHNVNNKINNKIDNHVDNYNDLYLKQQHEHEYEQQQQQQQQRELVNVPAINLLQSKNTDELNYKGLTGIFSTSLRRGSPFSVEIMGTHGFININDPANCPVSSVVNLGPDAYASTDMPFQFPVKPICQKNGIGPNFFNHPPPPRPPQFGPQQYPGTAGFVYVINAIDDCMNGKGEYKELASDNDDFRCLEMPELSSNEQITIMEVIESIRKQIGAIQD